MSVIYGTEISNNIRVGIKKEIEELINKGNRQPKLTVILVGDNDASKRYIRQKEKACFDLNILSEVIYLDENIQENELVEVIEKLNKDNTVDGILLQLPIPKHLDANVILNKISIYKDVDGFHTHYLGNLYHNDKGMVPCTPSGIMKMIDSVGYDLSGKDVVIIGRSNIVSKPLLHLMLHRNATVTITHSYTKELEEKTKKADVLVVAIGRAKMIDEKYIKEGAFVIDVGINFDENNKIVGDVNFDRVKDIVEYITPVPRGVGALTVTMLMNNTLELYKGHIKS